MSEYIEWKKNERSANLNFYHSTFTSNDGMPYGLSGYRLGYLPNISCVSVGRLDLRFRSGTTRGQLGPWPFGLNGNAMACFLQ